MGQGPGHDEQSDHTSPLTQGFLIYAHEPGGLYNLLFVLDKILSISMMQSGDIATLCMSPVCRLRHLDLTLEAMGSHSRF